MIKIKNILFFLCAWSFFLHAQSFDEFINQAQLQELKGNQTSNFQKRKNAYNQAIWFYNQALQIQESAEINYRQAKVYEQLDELPLALLSYQRSIKQGLPFEEIREDIKRLQIKMDSSLELIENFSPFYFSLYDLQKQTLFIFILLFILGSFYSWFPLSSIRFGLIFVSMMSLISTGVLMTEIYWSPIEAIVIKPTSLFLENEEDKNLEPILTLFAGKKIQIIDHLADKKWLKVKDASHTGFIASSSIQII